MLSFRVKNQTGKNVVDTKGTLVEKKVLQLHQTNYPLGLDQIWNLLIMHKFTRKSPFPPRLFPYQAWSAVHKKLQGSWTSEMTIEFLDKTNSLGV